MREVAEAYDVDDIVDVPPFPVAVKYLKPNARGGTDVIWTQVEANTTSGLIADVACEIVGKRQASKYHFEVFRTPPSTRNRFHP